MRVIVEVFALEESDDLQQGVGVNKQRAKKRLLRLDVMGQELLMFCHTQRLRVFSSLGFNTFNP